MFLGVAWRCRQIAVCETSGVMYVNVHADFHPWQKKRVSERRKSWQVSSRLRRLMKLVRALPPAHVCESWVRVRNVRWLLFVNVWLACCIIHAELCCATPYKTTCQHIRPTTVLVVCWQLRFGQRPSSCVLCKDQIKLSKCLWIVGYRGFEDLGHKLAVLSFFRVKGSRVLPKFLMWLWMVRRWTGSRSKVSRSLLQEVSGCWQNFLRGIVPSITCWGSFCKFCGAEEETPRRLLMICDVIKLTRARNFDQHQIY